VENGSVASGSGGGRYSDRSGSIDVNELGRVLSQGRVAFSPRTLRLMLHLFADNKSDTTRIGPVGFAKLWKEIQQWNKKFLEFDRDNNGSIEVSELQAALMSFNFNIPPAVLQMLVSKYDVTGGSRSIGYDNFVECGFIVKGLTQKFKDQDRNLTGNATFDYTTFMLMVIPFVAA
jgi:calcium-binding protein CML